MVSLLSKSADDCCAMIAEHDEAIEWATRLQFTAGAFCPPWTHGPMARDRRAYDGSAHVGEKATAWSGFDMER